MARKTTIREKLEGIIESLNKLAEKNPEFADSLGVSIKDARAEFSRVSFEEAAEVLVDLEEVNGRPDSGKFMEMVLVHMNYVRISRAKQRAEALEVKKQAAPAAPTPELITNPE